MLFLQENSLLIQQHRLLRQQPLDQLGHFAITSKQPDFFSLALLTKAVSHQRFSIQAQPPDSLLPDRRQRMQRAVVELNRMLRY